MGDVRRFDWVLTGKEDAAVIEELIGGGWVVVARCRTQNQAKKIAGLLNANSAAALPSGKLLETEGVVSFVQPSLKDRP